MNLFRLQEKEMKHRYCQEDDFRIPNWDFCTSRDDVRAAAVVGWLKVIVVLEKKTFKIQWLTIFKRSFNHVLIDIFQTHESMHIIKTC